ncbi:MAG: hypothetical protein H5U02_03910 [Clostridia bacterium]|nr:hypothetical protein [Clostridia bacterium]
MRECDGTVTINLFTEGDEFFDLLKAAIREWREAPWTHEQDRAKFALDLYNRGLSAYREYLTKAELRAEEGYNLERDRRWLENMRSKLGYWEKKLREVSQPTTSKRISSVNGR